MSANASDKAVARYTRCTAAVSYRCSVEVNFLSGNEENLERGLAVRHRRMAIVEIRGMTLQKFALKCQNIAKTEAKRGAVKLQCER